MTLNAIEYAKTPIEHLRNFLLTRPAVNIGGKVCHEAA